MEGFSHINDLDTHLIHRVFEEQARQYPDAIAVSYKNQRITYNELNSRSQQLARYLVNRGAEPERLIAICVERGLEMVVGLLAILKAGAAYVPIDPDLPADRKRYMLEDCKPLLLLTQQRLLTDLRSTATEIVTLSTAWDTIADTWGPAVATLPTRLTPRNLAYVIYTSGSTGTPKGVMVEHYGVVTFLAAMHERLHLRPGIKWTQFHSISFDFSVLEMWGALLSGGHLAIVPLITSRFPRDVHHLLSNEGVQVFGQTPSSFRKLVSAGVPRPYSLSLETIIFGGEALQVSSLKPWFDVEASRNVRIVNFYGPTEITVAATGHAVSPSDIDPHGGSVIGTALSNSTIIILDEDLGTVDPGGVGEINVGGAGVARGYLGRPDLTCQRFVADPTDSKGGRLYRSGDRGLWRTDRTLEYRGRNDSQVKVRGFRIELGDIESHLTAVEGVREGIVIVQDSSSDEARLVAYLTLNDGVSLTPRALRDRLIQCLPLYMVPSDFVILPQLPLNTSGKVDRKSLVSVVAPL